MIKNKQGMVLTGHGQDRRWRRMNRFSNREYDTVTGNERDRYHTGFELTPKMQRQRKVLGALMTVGLPGGYGITKVLYNEQNKGLSQAARHGNRPVIVNDHEDAEDIIRVGRAMKAAQSIRGR